MPPNLYETNIMAIADDDGPGRLLAARDAAWQLVAKGVSCVAIEKRGLVFMRARETRSEKYIANKRVEMGFSLPRI